MISPAKRSMLETIIYRLEGAWLYLHAYLTGLGHFLRGHNISWFDDPDVWSGHFGFITCRDCPDTIDENDEDRKEPSNLCIWGHDVHWLRKYILPKMCEKFGGHREIFEWEDGKTGTPTGHFSCGRCLKDVSSK